MEAAVTAAIIAGSVATLASIVAAYMTRSTLEETKRNNQTTLEEARRIKRKDTIAKTLNEFYGPVQSHLQVSKALDTLFKAGKPKDFRTLTYLLDPSQKYVTDSGGTETVVLTGPDKVLLSEIIEIGKKIEDIILTKGGLVDDQNLMFNYVPNNRATDIKFDITNVGLLSLAISHFHVLRLANEGKLVGNVEEYKKFVFPRELPPKIMEKIGSLQAELRRIENPDSLPADSTNVGSLMA